MTEYGWSAALDCGAAWDRWCALSFGAPGVAQDRPAAARLMARAVTGMTGGFTGEDLQ